MQVQPSNSFEHIGSLEDETSGQPSSPPADADLSDYLSPIREDALQLLRPDARRVHVLCFAVAGALAMGFGLGWASGATWYGAPTVIASIAQRNTSPPRTEMKPATKPESGRKQTASGTAFNGSSKAPSLSTGSVLRSDGQASRTAATSPPLDLPPARLPPANHFTRHRRHARLRLRAGQFATLEVEQRSLKDRMESGQQWSMTPCQVLAKLNRSCGGATAGSSPRPMG